MDERDQIRLLAEIAVASNQAEKIETALQEALDRICFYTDWPVGHAYLLRGDELIPAGIWHLDQSEFFANFREITNATHFHAGTGLPGMVLEKAEPVWISDVTQHPNFPRARIAGDIGVRSGFGLPVMVGKEVAGVLEFFSADIREPDQAILDLMRQIGTQLGRVIERQRALEELRESEERHRRTLDTSNDAYISIDSMGDIRAWNRAAENVFGWSSDEIIGLTLTETIIPPPFRRAHKEGFKKYLETGDGPVLYKTLELSALRRDGTEFPIELTIWPTERDGRPYFHAFVRDISERVRNQSLLRQFIADASHELRTPLTILSGMASMMETRFDKMTDSQVKELLAAMSRQGERAAALINNLLDLSRLDEHQMTLDLKELNLSSLIGQLLEDSPPPLGKQVETRVPSDLTVSADPTRLTQILSNLLLNAFRYGGSRIIITASQTPKMTEIVVEDDGEGVPSEIVAQLFRPFTRGRNVGAQAGSGLGLALCQRLAEVMDGIISYEARNPSGATFKLSIASQP